MINNSGARTVVRNVSETSMRMNATARFIASKKRKRVKFKPSGVRNGGISRVKEYFGI